ncbi:hypothetical protein [Hydrogenophaga borbori]|jgi:hypothetical protein|uniref:hypothetical protein n=1 Tax=Hydrogenophaga borbori TaxID=2294117 RepID=UPI00301D4450
MRFLLALLMLTLLPLQFSAAATSSCCGHAGASQVLEPQRHQPHHVFAAQGGHDVTPEGIDLDCGTCHVNCAAAVTATVETSVDAVGGVLGGYLVEANAPPWHEQPDRPQWLTPRDSGLNVFA